MCSKNRCVDAESDEEEKRLKLISGLSPGDKLLLQEEYERFIKSFTFEVWLRGLTREDIYKIIF